MHGDLLCIAEVADKREILEGCFLQRLLDEGPVLVDLELHEARRRRDVELALPHPLRRAALEHGKDSRSELLCLEKIQDIIPEDACLFVCGYLHACSLGVWCQFVENSL